MRNSDKHKAAANIKRFTVVEKEEVLNPNDDAFEDPKLI
jgi:hypothetical protein